MICAIFFNLHKAPFIKNIVLAANKMDEEEEKEDFEVFLELADTELPCLGLSTFTKRNLEEFVQRIYHISNIIRVYSKAPGKDPDKRAPFVVPKETTLDELASKIHKDFTRKLKYAKIWGDAVYDGQMVQKDYVLQDGDVVEIHI